MILCYAGRSRPSAQLIAEADPAIVPVRSGRGDVNWGRAVAYTELNPDISSVTNKRRMRQLFKEHDVPMPRLLSLSEAESYITRGGTVIGRPDRHTKGRGLWKISSPHQLRRALRGTRRKRAATHFMEYIAAPREYRVHIFKGKSIRISEKAFFATEDGHRDYTTARPQHNTNHVRRAAKQAVAAVGLDFGAVDILADDDQAWVLEVNAAPGLGGSMPRVYATTFRRWLEGDWND